MQIYCYNPNIHRGGLVQVEANIRRGLPGVDIVGMAGTAVREARDRVRAAIASAGFDFPAGHVVISLSPADVPKTGAAFDLAIALAILCAALREPSGSGPALLAMGELTLGSAVRRVDAVVPALLEAKGAGIGHFLVPRGNGQEAELVLPGQCRTAENLRDAYAALPPAGGADDAPVPPQRPPRAAGPDDGADFDIGLLDAQPMLKLALLAAAAGRHHLLIYGPPGAGKTMALRFLWRLLPDLDAGERLAVNRLHSLAGCIDDSNPLLVRPPLRAPHHASSAESLLGGGRGGKPGELSLAHRGLLILDEAAEFRKHVLQGLREPLEEGAIRLGRVGGTVRQAAEFQLGMSLNPCPCGRYGSGGESCACTALEIQNYWGRLGAALIDRIDIRLKLNGSRGAGGADRLLSGLDFLAERRDLAGLRSLVAGARAALAAVEPERGGAASGLGDWPVDLLPRARRAVHRLARSLAALAGRPEPTAADRAAALALRAPIAPVAGIELYR